MPKFSIVMPTYNRDHLVSRSIESLLDQTFKDYEIIVVDDGSTDGTKKVLQAFRDKIRYYYQKNGGVSAARNHGIEQAKSEYIAFTDDDVIADPAWLASIEKCFRENQCDVVGGRVLPIFPDNTPLWARNNPVKISGGIVIYDYGVETVPFDTSRYRFIGANFAFRKQVFDDCGVFSQDFVFDNNVNVGEDIEMIDRTIKHNKTLYYCGQALVHHPVYISRLTLRHAARWNKAWGCFCARQEFEDKNNHFIYWGGVPRYLWKGLFSDSLRLCVSVFDRLALYDACRSFFRKVGMIQEYRRMMKEAKIK